MTSGAQTPIRVSKRSRWIDALLQPRGPMFASDDEFWIHWFGERSGLLYARMIFRVASEGDARICIRTMPAHVTGGVAIRVPRDRADGTYGEAQVIAVRGDVPGDFALRVRTALRSQEDRAAGS